MKISHRPAVLFVSALLCVAAPGPGRAQEHHVVVPADRVQWSAAPPVLPAGAQISVLEGNPALAEVVQVELRQGHKFFRGASAHEVSAYFELIGGVLEEGIASGQVRRDLPVKLATKMLFGAMDQVATSWVLGKRAYRLSDAAEAVATIFLKGVSPDAV